MVDLEQLKSRGLRVYELGRFKAATRIACLILPIAVLCYFFCPEKEICVCLSALLLGLVVWLRWRNRQGVEDVTTGLLAGGVPLVVGLLLVGVAPECCSDSFLSFNNVWCSLVSVVSGLWIAFRIRHAPGERWLAASMVAILAGSLGCLTFGVFGIAGVTLGVVVGCSAGKISLGCSHS